MMERQPLHRLRLRLEQKLTGGSFILGCGERLTAFLHDCRNSTLFS
jgi:hypothetical protein